MPPAARITDMHVCPMVTGVVPHVGGPILPPGEPTVLIGGLPAARITDMATCVGPPDVIIMGSPTVLIGNLMAARIGDPTAHGGVIVLGCPTVIIGEAGAPSPSVSSLSPAVLQLAAAPGNSDDQQGARQLVARTFYTESCPSMTPAQVESHVRCIDFSQPVQIVQIPPPDALLRWGSPGSKGQYYTDDPTAKPTDLGVPDTAGALKRETHAVGVPMTCLKSTAAGVKADWVERPVQTAGGKTQYFIPIDKQVWKPLGPGA